MIRRPPRATQSRSSAASDVYKRQIEECAGPRKDRNLSLEAAREEHPVSDVFFKMGNGHSLQRDESGFRSFSRCTVPFFDAGQRPRKNRNDAA